MNKKVDKKFDLDNWKLEQCFKVKIFDENKKCLTLDGYKSCGECRYLTDRYKYCYII